MLISVAQIKWCVYVCHLKLFFVACENAFSGGADALPSLFDDALVHNVCHPFDLNLPQQDREQDNLLTGDYFQLVTWAYTYVC